MDATRPLHHHVRTTALTVILAPDTIVIDRIYCLSSPINRRRLFAKPFKNMIDY
jgi:hypothetical protein